jgi:hypothetical protein
MSPNQSNVASHTHGSLTLTASQAGPTTLRLRAEAEPSEQRRIQWAEDVIDNEGMGKKSSKGVFPFSGVCLSTDTRQQCAASTTNHARLVSLLTKTRLHLLPPIPTASPTPAEPSLQTAVATNTKIRMVHATIITPTLLIRTLLERASRRPASPVRMPMKECPRERHPRRIES